MSTDPILRGHDAAAAAAGWPSASADARARARSRGAIADFFLDDDARLDERTRRALGRVLAGVVGALDTAIRCHAARLLAARDRGGAAEALLARPSSLMARIARHGLLPAVVLEELIAQVRHDALADALPVQVGAPDEAGLLNRLTAAPDAVVATVAATLLAAENRRAGDDAARGGELPAELHHRLAWLVAAALHEASPNDHDLAEALAEAGARCIAAHDEGERLEAVAMRLASAIDARPGEYAALLVDALGDRRLTLFVAVLAHALGLAFAQVRDWLAAPDDGRLWLALAALRVGRTATARIALALAEADPRRDIEAFADRLDELVAIDPAAARRRLAPLTLPADFRAAADALAGR